MGHCAAAMRDGADRVLLLGGLRSQGTAEIVPGEDSQNVGEDKRYSPVKIFNTRFLPDGPSIPLQHFVFQSCAIHLVGQLIVTGGGTQFHQYVDRWPFDLRFLTHLLRRYDLTGRSRDLTGFLGPLPNMLQGRNGRACGSFFDTNGDQVC